MTVTPSLPNDRIADLETDNQNLYFIIGALTDVVEELSPIARAQYIKLLKTKAKSVTGDYATLLDRLAESFDSPSTDS